MKLLLSLSSFFPEHTAGTETYVLNLAQELQKLNVEVAVTFPSAGKQIQNYEYKGIKVYPFYVPLKTSVNEMNGLAEVSGINEFTEILEKIKPDIFHLHSLSRSMHAEHLKIAKQKGIKTVFTGHLGSTFCVKGDIQLFDKHTCNAYTSKQRCLACFIKKNKQKNVFSSKITAFFINILLNTPAKKYFPAFNIVKYKLYQHDLLKRFSDVNIAIAPWLKKAFEINNFSNNFLVKQGINSNFLKNNKIFKVVTPIKLVFVGRMHPEKGVHLIMEAINNFKTNFELTIITLPFADEMEYYEQMKRLFFEMGFTNWFENLSQYEVSEKLSDSNLLILPSKYEAAPLVILESFAKKMPVLGSDCIAIKDMAIHNNNGLLFKNGNVDSLKEQLQRIVQNPSLLNELSANITPPRTFEDVAGEMFDIYNQLLI